MRPRMAPQSNGCIHWTGHISQQGYGVVSVKGSMTPAHRVSYELHIGPIPEGAWIDHACHNGDTSCRGGDSCLHRRCVNPQHLEPVTPRENQHRSHLTAASKMACVNGHPFTEENTYYRPDGKGRQCRECIRTRARRNHKRKPPRERLKECKNGHPMTEQNTYHYGNRRICRECRREADRRQYWRSKED
ncbi:HNH endonuclease signature motif containing protein [Streptomyces canus]|uniref:HNH endonuclease signature motif containing protein n=1 Tax=Streptomyces canus TaxID=58343 RepID=UPI00386F602C